MPRLFRQLLAVVCAAAWPWRGPNPKDDDSPLEVSEEFLEVGRPLLIQDLAPHSTRCFPLAVEAQLTLRVLASVVGLAGFPALRAGWTPVRPGLEDGSETGLETLHQVVENKHRETRFFFCVRTFSLQGCDALLTVLTEESTLVQLRPNYPSVWQLGFGAGAGGPASLAFSVEPDFLEDTRITVLPVSGEVDVAVYANASVGNCSGRLLKASSLSGPDIVDVPPGHGQLCVLATGRGIVSVVAGPPFPGPFVIPAIPTAGLLTGCEQSRLWVNNGTDITVTAVADDASEITLGATLAKEALENRWKGVVPPGGSGAALVISGAEVAAAERSLGLAKKEAAVSLVTCRKDLRSEATRYWLTAVTETGVISLQDGVVAHASVGEDVWRDFRLLVGTKGEVTLSASSAGKVSLVADTARREHFLGYRWAAKHNGGNSRAVIRLTTDPQQVSQEVHLLECRLPCFVYLAATATAAAGDAAAGLEVLATGTFGEARFVRLAEGREVEQSLPPKGVQVFEYSLKRNDTAVVISVSRASGGAVFQVSAQPDFPESPLTTRRAEAVVLLEPSANAFQAAVHAAEPVLYVRVENPEEKVSSRFSVCARAEGHAKWLHNGVAADGAVKAWRYDRYRFFVTAAEASELLEMIVEVSPHRGSVVVYASCEPNQYPWAQRHDWSKEMSGQESLVFNSSSPKFRPGWIYVAITSPDLAAYSLRVTWGSGPVQLKDGFPEKGHVPESAVRWFSLPAAEEQPLAVRVEAVAGVVGICVQEYRPSTRLKRLFRWLGKGWRHAESGWQQELGCGFWAVANASADRLAAVDLPSKGKDSATALALLGLGQGAANVFGVTALGGEVVTLLEEQTILVDSLGPSCCMKPPNLRRLYRHFTRVPSGSLQLLVTPLGGNIGGAKLAARARGQAEWFQVAQAQDGLLQLQIPLDELVGPDLRSLHAGFWLEARLEVQRPLSFSLSLLHDFATREATPVTTRLVANVPVSGSLSEAAEARYAVQANPEEVQICLRPCFGQVQMLLSYDGLKSKVQDQIAAGNCTPLAAVSDSLVLERGGAFMWQSGDYWITSDTRQLAAAEANIGLKEVWVLRSANDKWAATVHDDLPELDTHLMQCAYEDGALLHVMDVLSVIPEELKSGKWTEDKAHVNVKNVIKGVIFDMMRESGIELATRVREEHIQLPDPPVLNFSHYMRPCGNFAKKNCEFSVTFSFDTASIGLSSSGWGSEPEIRYQVLAMEPAEDLHPDLPCGLLAAKQQDRVLASANVKVGKYSWRHRLEGTLEFERDFGNTTLVVNVLATLVFPSGQLLGAASYRAVELVPDQLGSPPQVPYIAGGIALLVVICLMTRSRKAGTGQARQVSLQEPIEMQATYDLHEDGVTGLLQQEHGGYVPPSV
ncbi:unnamed protein product [Effrenium voratum]|nr:unnamed protein product [Effrenium voratum]